MKLTFKIFRFNPSVDSSPRWSVYEVEVDKSATILDALLKIKENIDPSLTLRYSCRQAVCGSCGMIINGKERLACFTRVLELDSDIITIEPLKNFPVSKDLVTDFTELFIKEKTVKPYIIRRDLEEMMKPVGMYLQKEEETLRYLQFAECIECGLCVSACPTFSIDRLFLTPMVLNKAYRFSADPRDEGFEERLPIIDSEHGCWRCHFALACSNVCPKGIDPAKSIQYLKNLVTSHSLLELLLGRVKEKKKTELLARPHISSESEI